jgi:hypothetical protein
MKGKLVLLTVLILPTAFYIYFALGVPKGHRAPFFGPRQTVVVKDKNGDPKTDTIYYSVPYAECKTGNGSSFNLKELAGHLYLAIFVHPDSIKLQLPSLAEDLKLNKYKYHYARFAFFYPGDSLGNPGKNAPDFASDFGLGSDTAFTFFLSPVQFDSLQTAFFVADSNRKENPWVSKGDAVMIDHRGRIRGYYNIRTASQLKEMKEDITFIYKNDEGVQTIEETTIEKKKNK